MGTISPSLGSLLHFDLEMEVPASQIEWRRARLAAHNAALRRHVADRLAPQSLFHSRLLRDVRQMASTVRFEEMGELDLVILATKLTSIGYKVAIRSALSSPGSSCFHTLRNEFLIVAGTGRDEGTDFIVEARFKSHFTIPHPTERYEGVLDAVPEEIVAPSSALAPLVQLICSEMSQAFEQQGLALPPWRQEKSLLSKWLPAKARDMEVCTPGDSPRAASPQTLGSGSSALSTLGSGSITPSIISFDGESPRAVLRDARAVLEGRMLPSERALSAGIKPRSLLSAEIAAAAAACAIATLQDSYETAPKRSAGKQNVAPAATAETETERSEGAVGWLTPPIRRVRMQGPAVL